MISSLILFNSLYPHTLWSLFLFLLVIYILLYSAVTFFLKQFIFYFIYIFWITHFVNRTELGFTEITMDNISNTTFSITANGSISHSGPFSARISPSSSFSIFYKGYQLGYPFILTLYNTSI